MLEVPGLRYLVAAEVLALVVTFVCWWRVWKMPALVRIKVAAFSTALLAALRACALTIGIVATVP